MTLVLIFLEQGAVDDGIDSLSLSFESMDVHHDIRGVYQSVLELGGKELIGTSVNRFSRSIMITIVDGINGSVLDCKYKMRTGRTLMLEAITPNR